METYQFIEILIKRYPNNYELGAALRTIHHEITEYENLKYDAYLLFSQKGL